MEGDQRGEQSSHDKVDILRCAQRVGIKHNGVLQRLIVQRILGAAIPWCAALVLLLARLQARAPGFEFAWSRHSRGAELEAQARNEDTSKWGAVEQHRPGMTSPLPHACMLFEARNACCSMPQPHSYQDTCKPRSLRSHAAIDPHGPLDQRHQHRVCPAKPLAGAGFQVIDRHCRMQRLSRMQYS